jgi:hypothetical protein
VFVKEFEDQILLILVDGFVVEESATDVEENPFDGFWKRHGGWSPYRRIPVGEERWRKH